MPRNPNKFEITPEERLATSLREIVGICVSNKDVPELAGVLEEIETVALEGLYK